MNIFDGSRLALTVMLAIISFSLIVSGANAITYIDSCGTYSNAGENYQLNASIYDNSTSGTCIMLQGENITLDCQWHRVNGTSDNGIFANRKNIIVKNCIVDDFESDIVADRDNITIKDSIVYNATKGVAVQDNQNCLVENITLKDTGFFIGNSNGTVVKDSYVYDSKGRGVYAQNTEGGFTLRNIIIENSNNDEIRVDNSANFLIDLVDVDKSEITGFGIYLDNVENFSVTNSSLINVSEDGLTAKHSTNGSIDSVFISGGGDGMSFYDTNKTQITNSNVTNLNWRGIHFYSFEGISGENCEIKNVKVNNVTSIGIFLVSAHNFNITNSSIRDGGSDGIRLSSYSDNVVITDTISCSNSGYDINDVSSGSNSGDNNTCTDTSNWQDDASALGYCTNYCIYPTSINSCQELDTENMIYEISSNISATGSGFRCLDVQADNVTLDGKGHEINGNLNYSYIIYNDGFDDFTAKNFTVKNSDFYDIHIKNAVNTRIQDFRGEGGAYFTVVAEYSNDTTIDNFEIINNTYYGINLAETRGSILRNGKIESTGFFGLRSTSSYNLTVENVNVTHTPEDPYYYDFDIKVLGQFYTGETDECESITVSECYGTNGKPILFYNSQESIDGSTEFDQIILCDADDTTISGVNYNGNGINGISIMHSDNINFENSILTETHSNSLMFYDSNVTVNNVTVDKQDYLTRIMSSNVVANGFYIINPDTANSLEVYGNSTIYLTNSEITGNTTGIMFDNGEIYQSAYSSGNIYFEAVNSTFTKTSDSGYSMNLMCSSENCGETIVKLYDTTIDNYDVTNSTLEVFWSLSINNPNTASVSITNSTDDQVESFSDSRRVWLKENYVEPYNNLVSSNPHTVSSSKEGYTSFSSTFDITSPDSLLIDIERTVMGGLPSITGKLAVTLGYGIIGLFAVFNLMMLAISEEFRKPKNFIKIMIAVAIVLLMISSLLGAMGV